MKKVTTVIMALTMLMLFALMSSCSETPLPTENTLQLENTGILTRTSLYKTFDDPLVVDLLAGQNIPVGVVNIWNDFDYLYVKYEIIDTDWCIYETHVVITAEFEGDDPVWPGKSTNNKGNPSPGQFTYNMDHDCVYSYTETIPLTGLVSENLAIAAHAKIGKEVVVGDIAVPDCWETVWQIGDVETKFFNTDHYELTFYADEFNYSAINKYPQFTAPFIVGTTPTNEFPYLTRGDNSYATNFDVQWDGELPFGGRFTISWSPGGSGSEIKIVTVPDGTPVTIGPVIGAFELGNEWYLDKYPLTENSFSVDPLTFGTHLFNLLHTTGDGAYWDWVRLEKPCTEIVYDTIYESAWGEGLHFVDKGNWATWFPYFISCTIVGGDLQLTYNNCPPTAPNANPVFTVNSCPDDEGYYGEFGWSRDMCFPDSDAWFHMHIDQVLDNRLGDTYVYFSGIVDDGMKNGVTHPAIGNRFCLKVKDDAPDYFGYVWHASASPAVLAGLTYDGTKPIVGGDIIFY